MPDDNKIVAYGLLTSEEVRVLGKSLKHVYPLPSDGRFDDLIRALDRDMPRGSGSAASAE